MHPSFQKNIDQLNKAINKAQQSFEQYRKDWQKLLNNEMEAASFTKESLFHALELSYSYLNNKAIDCLTNQLIPTYNRHKLDQNAVLVPIGKLYNRRATLKKRLKSEGVVYEAKATSNSTHLLIGYRLKKEELEWLLAHQQDYILLTEPILTLFFVEHAAYYLMQEDVACTKIEQVKALLWHKENTNIELGLSFLESGGVPKSLLTSVFLLYKFSTDKDILKRALHLLKIYGSSALKNLLPKLKKNWWSTHYESWLKEAALKHWEVYQYEYLNQGLKPSLFQKAWRESPSLEQIKFLRAAMEAWSWGEGLNCMQLPDDFDLPTHANILYSCTHLKQLQLNPSYQNKIDILPKGISKLKLLEELTINTALKQFPSELKALSRLKKLKLNTASMSFSEDIFANGFEQLEELELTYYRRKKLPDSIGCLRQLKVLTIPSGDLEELPSSLRNLKQLVTLKLSNNKFQQVPDILYLLSQLKQLDISGYWMRWKEDEVHLLRSTLTNCTLKIK